MSGCCDDDAPHPLEVIPAGLDSIPRQFAGFPEVRQRLLERLADPDSVARQAALGAWRPYNGDYGSMSLEMWAYVADILGFYDERVANESYLGTAVRRPSLRRLVGLLGHTPTAGTAGTATVAAIADGPVPVTVPVGTGVRSRSFDGNPPQVFETTAATVIHPLLNSWSAGPFRRRPTVDSSFFVGDTAAQEGGKKDKSGSGENRVNRLLFLPAGFGLAEGEPCLIEGRPGVTFAEQVSRVTSIEDFRGKDGKSYVRVSLDPAIVIGEDVDLSTLRARRPTQTVVPTVNDPLGGGAALGTVGSTTRLYVDGPPTLYRAGDPVIAVRDESGPDTGFAFARLTSVTAAAVTVTSIPTTEIKNKDGSEVEIPSPVVVATELRLSPALGSEFLDPDSVTFHHGMVEAGQPTNVYRTEVTPAELAVSDGVPVDGPVRLPDDLPGLPDALTPAAGGGSVLESRFLLSDDVKTGALVDGRLTVAADGTARFQLLDVSQTEVAAFKLPLTIYANLLDVSRGDSVVAEVLGSGDAQKANQVFKLRKKPLTYLPGHVTGSGNLHDSTLIVRVDGIAWRAVPGFFGCGPGDQVCIVRHDDQQNTFVTFGDGIRGKRLPSGVGNVVADYRHGAGRAAPPANAIRQLAGAVKGLRTVRSPVSAAMGRDPDGPEDLRSSAPKTALLLGRAISTVDFAALAASAPGVIRATADWLWIPEQVQAGVVVHYIGDADAATVTALLRNQSDPTVPIQVSRADPIAVALSLTVEVDPRFVADDVVAAVAAHLETSVLAPEASVIGGTFWATDLFEAAAEIEGIVGVSAMTFTGEEAALMPKAVGGTCVPTGRYYDFTASGAISVSGVPATGLPPSPGKGGAP